MKMSSDPHKDNANSCRPDYNDKAAGDLEEYVLEVCSRGSTPESHKAVCLGPVGYGQGAPAYTCGCYKWPKLPSNLEQRENVCNPEIRQGCSDSSNSR